MDSGIWAVTMLRNEQDIVAQSIGHLVDQGIERMIVADNCSTDRTRHILEGLAATRPVQIVEDSDPAFRQSEKITRLVHMAGAEGARWIVPFDADEIWLTSDGRTLAQFLDAQTADIVEAEMFDFFPKPWEWLAPWRDPLRRINHRRAAEQGPNLRKVAFRYQPGVVVRTGNHGVEGLGRMADERLVVRHYQWRTFRQFRRKARDGKQAIEADPNARAIDCAHWREYGAMSTPRLLRRWAGLCTRENPVRDPYYGR